MKPDHLLTSPCPTDGPKRILVFIDWYLPGFRGGGPITSIANLVEALAGEFHFSIVTSDKDYGQRKPYPGITPDTWIEQGPFCRVWYCSGETNSYRHIRRIIAETDYDVLYLNSMFSLRYTIYPLWNSRAAKPEVAVLLAPRGMLHAGALSLKPLKKKLFLNAIRWMGIHKQIHFQATDAVEVTDIRKVFGKDAQIHEAPNLPRMRQSPFASIPKHPGTLHLVFLSRLTEKKGLHLLLEWLRDIPATLQLDIIGPDEEPGYWDLCKKRIAQLPPNIQVHKHDPLPHAEAVATVQAAHAFVMPTRGENFGHAIFEALSAGRPVLISDQTPWSGLAARSAGFDIPLQDAAAWKKALLQLVAMDQTEWERWANASWKLAQTFLEDQAMVADNIALFNGL
jgi:glycosyltransferase involved in cell wall biosynthesis